MSIAIAVVFALGAVSLLTSGLLFVMFRFERFVGLRYLLRARRSAFARTGLIVTSIIIAVGVAALLGGRGRSRELETFGVIVIMGAGQFFLMFALLRVFSVFTTVSTMGVVLGVGSLVVVLAVTSGFEREFEEKVLAVNAHLLIMSYGDPSLDESERVAEGYMKKLQGLPGLQRMAKFSMSAGEVMVGKVGAQLKGIDLESGGHELQSAMVQGNVADLGRPAPACPSGPNWAGGTGDSETSDGGAGRILLGAELARRLHAKVGDCIDILIPFSGEEIDAQPVGYKFAVVGLFRLGFHEYDTRLAYVSLQDARRLGSARTLYGVELRFNDPNRALEVEPEVVARLGYEPRLMDWQTLNHNLFMALEMQKVIIALFLMIIIIVAAFNIVASLTMIVLSKVREMAILGTMGARKATVMRLFVTAGSLVGFVGVGLGILYGLSVCALARSYGYPLDPKVYLIAKLPVEITARELLFVAVSTQLICVLATLYPALRAARLKVVDGLRYT